MKIITDVQFEEYNKIFLLLCRRKNPNIIYGLQWEKFAESVKCNFCNQSIVAEKRPDAYYYIQIYRNHMYQHLKEQNLLPFL